jgi:uncharacterized protein YukE
VTITYDENGGDTWTFPDHTKLFHNAKGELTEERLPDGTVFTKFDPQGRPVAGVVAGTDGAPGQAVTIAYRDDGSSVWSYVDHSTVYVNPLGDVVERTTSDGWRFYYGKDDVPVRATSPDGWTFTSFNADGMPTAGENNGLSATIEYTADGSVWTMSDGNVVTRDPAGAVVRMVTPDGAVFTSFDTAGRPLAGTVPGENGAPEPVTIRYLGDGSSVWTTAHGDQTFMEADGDIVKQTVHGWTLTNFNDNGDPMSADNGKQHADITYPGDGTAIWTFDDGTVVTRGDNGQILTMVTPGGWTFTSFDNGRPVAGSKGEQTVTIAYQADGSSVWTYGDGVTVTQDPAGKVIQVTTPEGWVFTTFDDHDNPTAGKNGDESVSIAYTYDPDGSVTSSVWTYGDGTKVYRSGDGTVTQMTTADGWTFTDFDSQGRPTAGHKDDTNASISYLPNGNSVWSLGADKPTLTYDKDGNLLTMVTPDGWVYDKFDDKGRPVHGSNGDLNLNVDVHYFPDGSMEWDFSDGSTLITDPDGVPLEQVIPNGDGGFYDIVFAVDLPKLKDAVDWTNYAQEEIVAAFDSLKKKVRTVSDNWSSPAGRDYATMSQDIETVTTNFINLFDDARRRLQGTYDNYVRTEGTNYENLRPPPPHSEWARPPKS